MKDVSRLYKDNDNGPLKPPPLPSAHVYTSNYCEENIYLLAQSLSNEAETHVSHSWSSLWEAYVVFMSNDEKTIALWNQKLRDGVVVWDYHVILVLRPRRAGDCFPSSGEIPGIQPAVHAWVYDYDSRVPMPCSWKEYVSAVFPYACGDGFEIPERYASLFRIVPARLYLDYFASDRTHMLVKGQEGVYLSAPPPYPLLCGSKARELQISNNLMSSFVTMQRLPASSAQQTNDAGHDAQGETAHATLGPVVYGEVLDMSGFLSWLDTSSRDEREDGGM